MPRKFNVYFAKIGGANLFCRSVYISPVVFLCIFFLKDILSDPIEFESQKQDNQVAPGGPLNLLEPYALLDSKFWGDNLTVWRALLNFWYKMERLDFWY